MNLSYDARKDNVPLTIGNARIGNSSGFLNNLRRCWLVAVGFTQPAGARGMLPPLERGLVV
jgi:hypothetical protein